MVFVMLIYTGFNVQKQKHLNSIKYTYITVMRKTFENNRIFY